MATEVIFDKSRLQALAPQWRDLRRDSFLECSPDDYADSIHSAAAQASMFLVAIWDEQASLQTLAPFLIEQGHHPFRLGERRLFRVPVRWLRLQGRSLIGDSSQGAIAEVLDAVSNELSRFDMLSFVDIPTESELFRALSSPGIAARWRYSGLSVKPAAHWVIDLPSTFDDYMAGFSAKSRQTMRRKVRSFEKNHGGQVRTIKSAAEIDEFLKFGEEISRQTYQWNVGQQLRNDESTRAVFRRFAERGILRSYLLYANDQPCAFLWGRLEDGTFHYETPGFLPDLKKASPGNVLLLRVIEDLIENTDCKVFDFGEGGDLSGYKSMYGNRTYASETIIAAARSALRQSAIVSFQFAWNHFREMGKSVIGQGKIYRELKRRLRRFDGSAPATSSQH